jgi:hypothetical protein
MNEAIPRSVQPVLWFVEALTFGLGPLFIGLAIPLFRRRVPPNWTYGFRLPSTMADERVWYDMNARAGLHMIVIGIAYCVLFTIIQLFEAQRSVELRLFVPIGFLFLAMVLDVIALGIAAGRQLRRLKAQDAAAAEGR